MSQRRTKSKAVDRAEAQRLYDELKSYRKVAKHLDSNYAAVYRALNPEASVIPNGQPPLPEHAPTDHPMASIRRNVAAHQSAPDGAPTNTLQQVLIGETVTPDERVDDNAALKSEVTALRAEVEKLKARGVEVDAWLQAFQQQAHRSAPRRTGAPERTSAPVWIKRGTHLAADMAEALKDYAATHRLEVREVHDMALREFFARHNAEEGEQ